MNKLFNISWNAWGWKVILEHIGIPSFQEGLIIIWGWTILRYTTMKWIRVGNLKIRNYLWAYEDLRFSTEVDYFYSIPFSYEIAEEAYSGHYDLAFYVESFYDWSSFLDEEDFPYVYFWDTEQDNVLGAVVPHAYLNILGDQYEFNNYYYQTDAMSKKFATMKLFQPFDVTGGGYKVLIFDGESNMAWYTEMLYSTIGNQYEANLATFSDFASAPTVDIKSFFDRVLNLPEANILDKFVSERSLNLSLLSVTRSTSLNTLTTYSLDSRFELFSGHVKHNIASGRHDAWFPTFVATKFRRV